MPPKTQNLHDIAVEHIRQCFNRTNQQVEQAGKDIAAYYFYLVDDFFLPQATPPLPIKT